MDGLKSLCLESRTFKMIVAVFLNRPSHINSFCLLVLIDLFIFLCKNCGGRY